MSEIFKALGAEDSISEEALYKAIEIRVKELLETNPELLMSYLYRLDVEEADIQLVLSPLSSDDPLQGLSKLILERQKARIATKRKYNQPPIEGWDEF